jgi:hypothetical protein
LKLNKACGIDGIPNECFRHLQRRPLVHCIRLSHFPTSWKEAKVVALPKPGKDQKIPQNLRPINLLPSTGKLFEKIILQIFQKHIEERNMLIASQFGFRARHSKTLQCIYTICLLIIPPNCRCKSSSLWELHLSICDRTQRGLCFEKKPAWPKFHIGLVSTLNIKINEEKTQAIYFPHQRRPPESLLTLNGRSIPFVNSVKYLGVIFDKRMTWRLHIGTIEAKAFRTFIRLYSLFKSERLCFKIKFTLHKALIRSVMTYACPAWEFAAETYLLKLQRIQNKVLRTAGNLSRRTLVCDIHVAFQIPYVYGYITKLCRRQAEIVHNHENENVRNVGQDKTSHRKHKKLKLGGGHLYDRSSV